MMARPGRDSVAPLISVALAMRMFYGLSLDLTDALNARWMCPIVGLAFFLPFAFAVGEAAKLGAGAPLDNLLPYVPKGAVTACRLLFALLLTLDATSVVYTTASSSKIIALKDVAAQFLVLPLALTVGVIALLGIKASGNSARIWLKTVPLFLLVLLLVQFKSYNPLWLAPLLGDGLGPILSGGVYCAGCMALLTLPWLCAAPDRNRRGLARYALFSALAAAALLATQQMVSPVQIYGALTRAARIEALLSNGRLMLSPQLIVNVLWFGCLLYLIAAEASTAADYFAEAIPNAPRWLWALFLTAATLVFPVWNPAILRMYRSWTGLMYIVIGGAFALLLALAWIGREEKRACGN